jgi:hypothetical protein
MKLSNIFKKETKSITPSNVQKLEKNQLEKVIGGTDDTTTTTIDPSFATVNTSRSNIKH